MSAFPDVRWGSESSRLRQPVLWLASTRPGAWAVRQIVPLDLRVLKRSNGRFTLAGPLGLPTLLLTTTGAKSGQPRTVPLLYARDGDALVVAGSNFGQAHHPAWTANLIAAPEATVGIGGRSVPVRAELLSGDEAEAAYQLLETVARNYTAYRSRTDRQIRVFRLHASLSPAGTAGS